MSSRYALNHRILLSELADHPLSSVLVLIRTIPGEHQIVNGIGAPLGGLGWVLCGWRGHVEGGQAGIVVRVSTGGTRPGSILSGRNTTNVNVGTNGCVHSHGRGYETGRNFAHHK